jgi:alginate O-acetyltransferase complex protein AlgI
MLFNSVEFALFFVAIVTLHFLIPFRWRWALLLVGSYVFYMWWRWEYAFLIATQTGLHFYCGRRIARSEDNSRKRFWLITGLSGGLGLLFFFKYYDFARRSLETAGQAVGADVALPLIDIILPVGISFYTFQALSYTIDVYRGQLKEERHFGRFALFVSFFPQLVAGPIERASNLLVQFRRKTFLDLDRLSSGLKLMLWGLFKKVVIADRLAIFVNQIYADPTAHSGPTLLLATYFFTFQIYCDFSGYSDIAIGAARILGYDLMQNFRLPYFAKSISEFWERWHISLSTWFRDYLYFPIGGNRVGYYRWCFNIIVVFAISGLWHGANWTFVVWGLLHGSYYLIERTAGPYAKNLVEALRLPKPLISLAQIAFTFHLVVIAWVFFRASSIHNAFFIVGRILGDLAGPIYLGPSTVTTALGMALILFLVGVQILQARDQISVHFSSTRWPVWLRWPTYATLIFGISIFGISNNEFIYFQF